MRRKVAQRLFVLGVSIGAVLALNHHAGATCGPDGKAACPETTTTTLPVVTTTTLPEAPPTTAVVAIPKTLTG